MDQHLLLDYLLGLEDKPFLEGLYFLVHLVQVRISALQTSASVNIQWVLQFLRQGFDFEFFLNQFRLEVEYLLFVLRDPLRILHQYLQLPP